MKPRTQFLDYDARREPRTELWCVKCQKDIKPSSKYRAVYLYVADMHVIHPDDVALFDKPFEVQCIGMDCAKMIGLEWTIESPRRST